MASDDLFEGLPPPAAAAGGGEGAASPFPPPPPPPPLPLPLPRPPALKSALKRDKPSSSDAAAAASPAAATDAAAEGRGEIERILAGPEVHVLIAGFGVVVLMRALLIGEFLDRL